MRRMQWAMAALVLPLGAAEAQAQQIEANQDAVIAELKGRGYRAELLPGEKSDAVRTSESGVPITIMFNDCKNGKRSCKSVEFYTGFANIDLTLEQVNEWNARVRWVRAYIDKEGDPGLEMDVDMDFGGISRALFWDNFQVFVGMVGKFRSEFGK